MSTQPPPAQAYNLYYKAPITAGSRAHHSGQAGTAGAQRDGLLPGISAGCRLADCPGPCTPPGRPCPGQWTGQWCGCGRFPVPLAPPPAKRRCFCLKVSSGLKGTGEHTACTKISKKHVCFPSLPPMLLRGYESCLGLESSGFSMWHFLKLVARGFLRVLWFPPLFHRLMLQPIK